MAAYPVLLQDQTVMSASQQPTQWTSAMTYKFVGTLRSLTDVKPYQRTAILVGIALGFATELLRKLIAANRRYRDYLQRGRGAGVMDFTIFGLILPSPLRILVRRLRQPADFCVVCRRQCAGGQL